ncbi:MAG TPA: cation:proton antiporter, partial [Phycisphaerae bacterium]|nr:cation:proton antiporter [Phycisphaerae bacterium]
MESHLGLLFVLGIGVLGGTIGALLFQKLKVPQVVGYIGIGLLIGDTGFGIVPSDQIAQFKQLNLFALGIIGFLVGGELSGDIFRKYGKQFMGILMGEGLAAFILVGIASGLVIYFVVHNTAAAVAAGIVFGAIASATDPASTIDVLWEYRSRGILTTAIIAIVALDDALAMTLYGLGTSAAGMLMGENASFAAAFMKLSVELFGSILLGGVAGLLLNWI